MTLAWSADGYPGWSADGLAGWSADGFAGSGAANDAIEQVIAILTAAAGVTALVGNHIWPLVRPEDLTLPAVTVQEISLNAANTFTGNGHLDDCRVQVNSWAASYTDARKLARAVRAAMDAVPLLMQSKNEGFDLEPIPGVFWVAQDYLVWS